MATLKPRITITLEPHAYEVVRRLSAAQGQSMSSLVTQFLDVATPQMERMVVLLERAKAAPEKAREDLRQALARAEANVLPVLLDVIQEQDMFLHEVGAELEAEPAPRATAPAPRPRKKATTPVPVTRGSGPAKRQKRGR